MEKELNEGYQIRIRELRDTINKLMARKDKINIKIKACREELALIAGTKYNTKF